MARFPNRNPATWPEPDDPAELRAAGRCMTSTPYYLALDFGGTKHAAGLMEAGARRWLDLRRVPAPPGSDGPTDRAVMLQLADELLAAHPGALAAVGVSFGGPVDWKTGRVILSHHVPGWEDTPLTTMLQDRYRAPVAMDNDANTAALGEWRFGAGRGCDSLLYITVSTGIGDGWVLNGSERRPDARHIQQETDCVAHRD